MVITQQPIKKQMHILCCLCQVRVDLYLAFGFVSISFGQQPLSINRGGTTRKFVSIKYALSCMQPVAPIWLICSLFLVHSEILGIGSRITYIVVGLIVFLFVCGRINIIIYNVCMFVRQCCITCMPKIEDRDVTWF